MLFTPLPNDSININGAQYQFSEHPGLPSGSGIAYGQEGRAGIVYQLVDGKGNNHALKVFKLLYRKPSLVGLSEKLLPYASLHGLTVCDRTVLTAQQYGEPVRQHPDLLYAVLMPWIEGQTWMYVVEERKAISSEQSLALAREFVSILETLEQEGIAHGDLSGSNLIFGGFDAGDIQIELVDVEQLYAPTLACPEEMPGGSPGYAHHRADDNLWQADMDRFAGALLLAEMLGWCDERVRVLSNGETYFGEDELHKENDRFDLMLSVLTERWGEEVAGLLRRAWESDTLAECPTFGEWWIALSPEEESGYDEAIAAQLAIAQAAVAKKAWPAALTAYRTVLDMAEPNGSLEREVQMIIDRLEKHARSPKGSARAENEGDYFIYPETGQVFPINEKQRTSRIGRSKYYPINLSALPNSDWVTRRHASLIRRTSGYWIKDLESRNGTIVDGYKLSPRESVELHDGSRVQFGGKKGPLLIFCTNLTSG